MIYGNLANSLMRVGKKKPDALRLYKTIEVLRNAHTLATQDRAPFEWAAIQVNIGNVWLDLGELKVSVDAFEKARDAFHAALTEVKPCTRFQYASIHLNLGNTYVQLSRFRAGVSELKDAVAAYDEALRYFIEPQEAWYAEYCRKYRGWALELIAARVR